MAAQLPQVKLTSVHITVHVKPEEIDKFFQIFTPTYKLVTAEPECVSFEVYQDPVNPGTISWVENWTESPEWLMNALATKEYLKEYLAKTESLLVKETEVRVLKRLEEFVYAKKETFEGGELRE